MGKELEDGGEHDVVGEGRADQGEEDAHGGEDVDEASLAEVEAGRDELPELVEEPGRTDQQGEHQADIEVGVEVFEQAGDLHVAALLARGLLLDERRGEQVHEPVGIIHGDDEDRHDTEHGEDEPLAEFVEVFAEGHDPLGLWFCWCG